MVLGTDKAKNNIELHFDGTEIAYVHEKNSLKSLLTTSLVGNHMLNKKQKYLKP